MFEIAERAQRIAPFHVMALLAQAQALEAQGKDVIHLEVGEPDFATPASIVAAGQAALAAGHTRYTPAGGLPALREAIAGYYQQRFGVNLAPQQIIVTPGASGALALATELLFNPGDGVLLADPGYPCNRYFLERLGVLPQWVATDESCAFQLNAALVDDHWQANTRGVLLASPSNPTGTQVDLHAMRDLYRTVVERQGALIVDEIYQGLNYECSPITALAITHKADQLLVINSFSKYFGMTGWRLGWLVAPLAWVETLERIAQNAYLAAPTIAQHAALAAFEPRTIMLLEQQRAQLQERRDYLLNALPELGFRIAAIPQGAFYLYLDVSAMTADSYGFCQELLAHTGVALTPGIDFAQRDAARYCRVAYTCPVERLQEAMQRIAGYLRAR